MQPSAQALQVDTFLPYMRDVVRCEGSLRELNLTWRMIEASAKINCPQEARSILPMMTATRVGFERLEKDLVTSLVGERVAHVLDEVGTKASHVVNIIVRNLYERTADVGFLATDRELCDFVAGVQPDRSRAIARLRAYRDKYTVYNDILLLDTEGNVLAQIDEDSPVEGSRDPLLAQTLASDHYVETFRATDLRPGDRSALIYSRRMHAADGRVVGVLCLSFDFLPEMAGIFRSRRDAEDRSLMLLLDADNRVIASADELWVPVGTEVPVHHGDEARLVMLSGREYLVRTYRADPYQGYAGPPGWQGSVMIPINVAFTGQRSQALETLDPAIASGLLTHARSFCPPLFEIITAAQSIRRVVWNGQVMTASQRRDLHKLKSILEQVSDTGARTNALFSDSIRDLYDTVLGSTRRRSEFTARLLVDLVDRNLYERSDDCRWWALTPQLRQALADGTAAHERQTLDAILEDIHALYTVYTRLVVYDAEGRVVAGTALQGPDGSSSLIGATIEADDLQAVLALRDPQAYHVSPFRGGVLSGGEPTYVYHAAVRDPDNEARVVGGIGIVFDSARELQAMLQGGLVNHGSGGALFVDRSGRVIASTPGGPEIGHMTTLGPDMLGVPAGQSRSIIKVYRGQYMVVACSANSGYREFKVSDGYRDDVLAVVFEPLGAEQQGRSADDGMTLHIEPDPDLENGEEYATFFVDGQLHALPAAHVLQASPASEIVRVSLDRAAWRLGTLALRSNGQTERYVWVHDLIGLATGRTSSHLADQQVIVVRHDGRDLGLLVDSLHGVPEFSARDITELPHEGGARSGFVRHLIKANGGALLIPVIDLDELWPRLGGQRPPTPALPQALSTV